MKGKQVIVFPANGSDINTVHPDFAHEEQYARAAGAHIVIVDLDNLASTREIVASGILPKDMALDYDSVEITAEEIREWVRANRFSPVAYDVRGFYRLPKSVDDGFYQLLRWKMGICLVEAVLDTADYGRVKYHQNYRLNELVADKGSPDQRQWWLDGKMVLSVSLDGSEKVSPLPPVFSQKLLEAVESMGRSLVVVDIAKAKNGRRSVLAYHEGQSFPLPKDIDLTDYFKALVNY